MKTTIVQRMPWRELEAQDPELLHTREWLVTNGRGGYASATVSGVCTRRYHGLLIAALPAPLGRFLMFNHLSEELKLGDRKLIRLGGGTTLGDTSIGERLGEFRLESGIPVWRYEIGHVRLEKRILMPHLQNTVYVIYRLIASPESVRLRLRPSVHFRPHEAAVDQPFVHPYSVTCRDDLIEIHSGDAPRLRMRVVADRDSFVLDGGQRRALEYVTERARGYTFQGELWSPGYYRADFEEGEEVTLVASTEDWDTLTAVDAPAALAAEQKRRQRLLTQSKLVESDTTDVRHDLAAKLVLAADQFIIRPSTRPKDLALAQAIGDDARAVIAGYHWFTDWGRDTMISLEGLTLLTGRHAEAGYLMRSYGRYVRDGLIPNLFPEGETEGLYHTVDATLWYFHALQRYLEYTDDWNTVLGLLPTLESIIEHHIQGTRFGIRVDGNDNLLTQGEHGYQLTWMDAKVGDWVVTPRRGKAVEINALWFNALKLLEHWQTRAGNAAASCRLADLARRTQTSFNRRFWFAEGNYLYDIVDGESGDDLALRPNQIFAISLDHPVLEPSWWKPVVETVTARLLTPYGLRTLAPGHPDYKPTYDGDLRARDAAYHQGTVWPWLIGPFIDAWLRVYPQDAENALQILAGFEPHLNEACIGSVSEVFDAEAPYHPRGCVAQAWSVAEVLRAFAKVQRQVVGN
jgi:predicted glycogen debranching enzyme